MFICKPCLEKSSKDSNKIYQLFASIPFNSYFWKNPKIWYQLFQGRHSSWSSTSANLDAVSQQLFHKENSTAVLFFAVWRIFGIDIKSNPWWVAQKILSKVLPRSRRGRLTGNWSQLSQKLWVISNRLQKNIFDKALL